MRRVNKLKFKLIFELSPSAPFGVPQESYIVRPTKTEEIFGSSYHTHNMVKTGHGTMSLFREEKEAINLSMKLNNCLAEVRDNYLSIIVESEEVNGVYKKVTDLVDEYLQHLTISQNRLFKYKALVLESDDGQNYKLPKTVRMGSFTTYNLKKLKKDLLKSAKMMSMSDDKLKRALFYFEHSLLLYDARDSIVSAFTRHHSQLISSAFLNLWKAISVILGDPSKSVDKDYQKRYKKLGISFSYFSSKIEKIRNFRNDYDIAHYDLTEESIKEIEINYGKSQTIVSEVLSKYRNSLISKN